MIQIQHDKMPLKQAGFINFITGTLPNSKNKIVAVQAPFATTLIDENELTFVEDGIYVYKDSIATIPKGISDADAISTASAALCGVHCGFVASGSDDGASESARKGKVSLFVFLFFV